MESPGLALDPSECGALASIPNVELVRDLPAPSEGVTLLMLPGAEADCARVAAAIDVLTRNDDLAGVVEIAADEPGYSLAYDLALSPERVNAMLIQNDALVALALGDMRSLHLAQAAVAAACALELSRSPLLVSAPSPPVDAAVWGREAIRSFAVEELFPQLREGGSEREYHELLIEFAAKLLEKGRLGDGFALGAYAEKIGEGRDPGSRSRLYTPRGAPPAGATSAGETSDPLVSVIIPTRNRPALLARAVESVAMQSVDDVEVIVVNDGGDEPGPVLAPYREAFRAPGRMLVVSQMPGRGPSAARNLGLRLARGRYVGFLDDDDRLLPHHLAALLPALQGGARVVHADARSIDERPAHPLPCTQRIRLHYQFRYEPFHFLIENSFPIQSTLCERQLLLVAGGWDETLTMLEDWDLWLRVFSLASPVRVARVTSEVHRLLGGESLSANPDGEWLEAQAYVYGKTIDREHQLPQLRCARVQHLVARAREFGVLFPRRAADWLRGDARLQPIDPDHPEEFAFDPVSGCLSGQPEEAGVVASDDLERQISEGTRLIDTQEHAGAFSLFGAARERLGDQPRLLLGLAHVSFHMGNPHRAFELLQDAHSLDPHDVDIVVSWASAAEKLGRLDELREPILHAGELSTTDEDLRSLCKLFRPAPSG